jgi:hypothetical protein
MPASLAATVTRTLSALAQPFPVDPVTGDGNHIGEAFTLVNTADGAIIFGGVCRAAAAGVSLAGWPGNKSFVPNLPMKSACL